MWRFDHSIPFFLLVLSLTSVHNTPRPRPTAPIVDSPRRSQVQGCRGSFEEDFYSLGQARPELVLSIANSFFARKCDWSIIMHKTKWSGTHKLCFLPGKWTEKLARDGKFGVFAILSGGWKWSRIQSSWAQFRIVSNYKDLKRKIDESGKKDKEGQSIDDGLQWKEQEKGFHDQGMKMGAKGIKRWTTHPFSLFSPSSFLEQGKRNSRKQ